MQTQLAIFTLTALGLLVGSFVQLTWLYNFYAAKFFDLSPASGTEYDYIVVGSGSAGSPVAGRLAEAGHSVLLIEAGGPSHFLQGIPAFAPNFMLGLYDWGYVQTKREGIWVDGPVYPRGKVLGGSSMLNWMHYFRGHSGDFDEWEKLGNPGWGWKDVEPYFRSAEKFVGNDKRGIYGKDGRLSVEEARFRYKADEFVFDAIKELGFPIGDVNGKEESEGFWERTVAATNMGWRAGTYNGFVRPLLGKKDIRVLTYATAKEVILDGNVAKGVKVERFGEEELSYYARKEVILSAGAIGSAQILMLSGIGPAKELKKHGIPLKKDLPVGENLQDHCLTIAAFAVADQERITVSPFLAYNPLNVYNYTVNGDGPMTYNGLGVNGVWHTKHAKKEKRPDMQLHVCPFDYATDYGVGFRYMMGHTDAYHDTVYAPRYGKQGIILLPTLLRPNSRGSVTLSGPSIHDDPVIEPNYLKHPDDLKAMVEGLKFSKALEKTKSFQEHGFKMLEPDTLFCGKHKPYSDDYFACYAKHHVQTVYHPVSTCTMGKDPKESVVDHRLRVHGVKNLRVADSSVMPRLVGANTNASCVMIGEKAASIILEDAARKQSSSKTGKPSKSSKDEL